MATDLWSQILLYLPLKRRELVTGASLHDEVDTTFPGGRVSGTSRRRSGYWCSKLQFRCCRGSRSTNDQLLERSPYLQAPKRDWTQ